MLRHAIVGFLAVSLAGCGTPDASVNFDGDAAWDFTHDLVTYANGTDRFRVPGTQGHADGADWLDAAMQISGWSVTRQSFSGSDYESLDAGGVSGYQTGSLCTEPDRSEVPDLAFHNLYATHGASDRMVWLGAHWESKEDASDGGAVLGANDGAAGVGLLLQLMHHVAAGDIDVPFGIGVVFFDGEDGFEDCHPLAGSVYFARTMQHGLVDRFILLDMIGDKNARFIREGHSVGADRDLVDLLWTHGAKYAPAAFTTSSRTIADDHLPFIEEGVRAVDLIDGGRATTFPPYWHTSGDTMENIDRDMLRAVGNTVWATLIDPGFERSL